LIDRPDDPAMSIVARRGRIVAEPRSRLLRFERPSMVAAAAGAVGSLIEPDDPRHELARLALDLVVRTSEPLSLPRRWTTVPFVREVDRTRAQLEPIRTRAALAASFSREASVAVSRSLDPSTDTPPGPVRVAYAIRWLELGDDRRRPDWTSMVNGVVDDLLAAVARTVPPDVDSTSA
jgi:hypothetical protein